LQPRHVNHISIRWKKPKSKMLDVGRYLVNMRN
jgi:hypothetical protein